MKRLMSLVMIVLLILSSLMPVNTRAEEEKRTLESEIVYNIFVDRFNNGDAKRHEQVDINDELAYHGGDIKGIEMRLDVLQNMGFTTLVLSPIMENAKKGYHGYWVEDFYSIDNQFGDEKALKKLIKAAHKRDMKIVLELVTNYSADSFLEKEKKAKEDWFKENDVLPIKANEWLNDSLTFNQENKEVKDYLFNVAEYWMDTYDIDGYKLHAADQANQEFLEELTSKIKEKNKDFYLLAGLLQDDIESDTSALKSNENIDAVENVKMFETLNSVFQESDKSPTEIFDVWKETERTNDILYVDNINTARFSNNFADHGRNSITAWSLALTTMYTTPGVPVIYQGSETPMYGPGYPENRYMVDSTSSDQDLEKVFEKLGTIRDNFPALVNGSYEFVTSNEGLTLFKRADKDQTLYVAINNDTKSRVVTIDDLTDDFQLNGLMQDHIVRAGTDGKFEVGLPRETAEIFILEENKGFNWVFIGFVASVFIFFIYFVNRLTRLQKKRETGSK